MNRNLLRRAVARGVVATAFTALTGAMGAACLTTPVAPGEPQGKSNFTSTINQSKVERIDLLFAIDNSASMADKQALLGEAIPDLLTRLLTPKCVLESDPTKSSNRVNGDCPSGTKEEFTPIKDMHVGIVSSSLGTPGSVGNPVCPNDGAYLVNRDQSTRPVHTSDFLAWYPPLQDGDTRPGPAPANAIGNQDELEQTFNDMVLGVGERGCGYEAQNESWYRFLVQPDPYKSVDSSSGIAVYQGVDEKILQQRHDFLRPDSLVAIIVVTDENESTADPRSLGGRGFNMMDNSQILTRGAAICETQPSSPGCVQGQGDEELEAAGNKNVRFFHPKQRFGFDPFYPVSRYINGLGISSSGLPQTAPRVPDRDGEHPNGTEPYGGLDTSKDFRNCVNPLFAAELPTKATDELCKLTQGPRSPALVFYAAITGVPHQLLHFDPNDPAKSRLSNNDWTKILGADPLNGDFTGADPHMLESVEKRSALAGETDDEIHGREFDTKGNDLQYACTFPIAGRECAANDPLCDCAAGSDAPVCEGRRQVRAKAYPGVRHLALARALGEQGIVSSVCPITTSAQAKNSGSLEYGYRPAVTVIVDRLKNALTAQCLPRKLEPLSDGSFPCLVLEMLAVPGAQASCDDPERGLKQPDAKVLEKFREAQRELHKDDGFNPDDYPVCELADISSDGVNCSVGTNQPAGWCYVSGEDSLSATGGSCSNSILFSKAGDPPTGTRVFLQCIQGSAAVPTTTTGE